jgi:hypothetical protein
LSCRYAAEISIVRPIIPSFVRSFIVPIHRSSFVHRHYSSFVHTTIHITIHPYYSSLLFTIVNIHRHYSPSLLYNDTIHHRYYSSMISMVTFSLLLFIVTIHRCYLSLLFIDHPITPNFNYSSIMLSSPPKTSQTHIPVIRTPMTVIFLPVGNFPSGHSSQVSPS